MNKDALYVDQSISDKLDEILMKDYFGSCKLNLYTTEMPSSDILKTYSTDYPGFAGYANFGMSNGQMTSPAKVTTTDDAIQYSEGDLYWDNVTFLSHFDGESIIDEKGATITPSGSVGTSADQVKFGTRSGYFNGVDSRFTVPQNTDYAFGTGDFTVEMWIRPSTIAPTWQGLVGTGPGAAANPYFALNLGSPSIYYSDTVIATGPAVTVNDWNHVAFVRSNGIITIYTNGVAGSSIVDNTSLTNEAALHVGASTLNAQHFNGYMDDLRITKGVARYTENFAVPTEAYDNTLSENLGMIGTYNWFQLRSGSNALYGNISDLNDYANGIVKDVVLTEKDLSVNPTPDVYEIDFKFNAIGITDHPVPEAYSNDEYKDYVVLYLDGAGNVGDTKLVDHSEYSRTLINNDVLIVTDTDGENKRLEFNGYTLGAKTEVLSDYNLGSEDFTIDFTFTPDNQPKTDPTIISFNTGNAGWIADTIDILFDSTNMVNKLSMKSFNISSSVNDALLVSDVLVPTTTYNVRITRNKETLSLYIDQELVDTYLLPSEDYSMTTNPSSNMCISLGYHTNDSTSSMFRGFLDNFVFTKGKAKLVEEPYISDLRLLVQASRDYVADDGRPLMTSESEDATGSITKSTTVKLFDSSYNVETNDIFYAKVSYDDFYSVGTGDFTWEGNFYLTDSSEKVLMGYSRSATDNVQVKLTAGGNLEFIYNGLVVTSGSFDVAKLNTWIHVALVRNGNWVSIFVDGNENSRHFNNINLQNHSYKFGIGCDPYNVGLGINGYVDQVRVTTVSRYLEDFSVPTTEFYGARVAKKDLIYKDDFFGDDSTIGFYPLDNTLRDMVGGNHGTSVSRAYTDGKFYDSKVFGRTLSDSVYLPEGTLDFATGTNQWAYSLWFKPYEISNYISFIAPDVDFKRPGLYIYNGKMGYFASSNGSSWNVIGADTGAMNGTGTINLVQNQWTHVVFTRDSEGIKGYINGVLDKAFTVDPSLELYAKDAIKGTFGRWGYTNENYTMNGELDHIRFFNRGLTEAEVGLLYAEVPLVEQSSVVDVPGELKQTTLQLHLDATKPETYSKAFNTWYDLSGNSNDAKLNGKTEFVESTPSYFNMPSGKNGARVYYSPTYTRGATKEMTYEFVIKFNADMVGEFFERGEVGAEKPRILQNSLQVIYDWTNTNNGINVPIQLNRIAHLVFTIKENGSVVAYKNGAPIGSLYAGSDLYDSITDLLIGYSNGYSRGSDIEIYSLRIYNSQLTDAEVLNNYNVIKDTFGLPETFISSPSIVATVVGSEDGSQFTTTSTLIEGAVYNNRDFWTYDGKIGSHGALNNSMLVVFDSGFGNEWQITTATSYPGNTTYPYVAPVHWYVSDDNITWTLISETSGSDVADGEIPMTFTGDTGRYLKIVHDIQPLNTYSLSVSAYKNSDLKIVKKEQVSHVSSNMYDVGDIAVLNYTSGAYSGFYTLKQALQDTTNLPEGSATYGPNNWQSKIVHGASVGVPYTEILDAGAGKEFVVGDVTVISHPSLADVGTDPFVVSVSDDLTNWTVAGSMETENFDYNGLTVPLSGNGRYMKIEITPTTVTASNHARFYLALTDNPWNLTIRAK